MFLLDYLVLCFFITLSAVAIDTRETCYEEFCYTIDRDHYRSNDNPCREPYWGLEIYSENVQNEVDQFIEDNVALNSRVLLFMTCDDDGCRWKKTNTSLTYTNWHNPNNRPNKNGFVFFNSNSNGNKWRFFDDPNYSFRVICMKSSPKSEETRTSTTSSISIHNGKTSSDDKKEGSDSNFKDQLIWIILGSACAVLFVVLVVLLVLFVRKEIHRRKVFGGRPMKQRSERQVQNHPVECDVAQTVSQPTISVLQHVHSLPQPTKTETTVVHTVQKPAGVVSPYVTTISKPTIENSTYDEVVLPRANLKKEQCYSNIQESLNPVAENPSSMVYADLDWPEKRGQFSAEFDGSCTYSNVDGINQCQSDVYSIVQK